MTKVVRSPHQPLAKVPPPDAVDQHPGRQWMLGTREPACQFKPSTGPHGNLCIGPIRIQQNNREAPGDNVTASPVVPGHVDPQVGGFLVVEGNHGRGQPGKDGGRQFPGLRLQVGQLFPLAGRIKRPGIGSGNKRTVLGRQSLDQLGAVQIDPGPDLVDTLRKLESQSMQR